VYSPYTSPVSLLTSLSASFSERRSRSLFAVVSPYVCRLSVCQSVTLVHPTQAVVNFGNLSMVFGIGHPLTHTENFMEIVSGEPLRWASGS